ncbi:hypothetical protein DASC09_057930 [Saccharomycopsis crataegensis]|uniref:Uncharacterized protein n=1 Tax=Saccharomycopsis crataegensis TaxID=43959 RepID=A0AAV5QUN8_9ASCO|nr:hypothetical protein DASC09_057930 [Saccharomycopsis crataegensis]
MASRKLNKEDDESLDDSEQIELVATVSIKTIVTSSLTSDGAANPMAFNKNIVEGILKFQASCQ